MITKTRTEQTYYSKITQKAPATQLLTKKVLQKFDSFCKANYNSTILYSDFLADKLCSYVIHKYIDRQNYDTILKIFQDKEIMIPLLVDDKEPSFVGMAKDMYK